MRRVPQGGAHQASDHARASAAAATAAAASSAPRRGDSAKVGVPPPQPHSSSLPRYALSHRSWCTCARGARAHTTRWLVCLCTAGHLTRLEAGLRSRRGVLRRARTQHERPGGALRLVARTSTRAASHCLVCQCRCRCCRTRTRQPPALPPPSRSPPSPPGDGATTTSPNSATARSSPSPGRCAGPAHAVGNAPHHRPRPQ